MQPNIVSRAAWLSARRDLLAKEKATQARDALDGRWLKHHDRY